MTHSRSSGIPLAAELTMATRPQDLGHEPAHFADCCVAISRPLIEAIAVHLPPKPSLILSIGSGRGLLEHLLLQYMSAEDATPVDLYGVEVPTCVNKYLPEGRVLRVASTSTLYADAMFASALLFVYPRQVSLIAQYLDACLNAALEKVLWLGHRSDWPDAEGTVSAAFSSLEYYSGPGLTDYELLVIASNPRMP